MRGNQYNERLRGALEAKNVLVMAHRGVSGANIVDNTIESYDVAIRHGADIVEVDVCSTLDGDLFVLHDGMEPMVLGQQESIIHMRTAEVRKLRYRNKNNTRIDHPVNTFDEVLEHLKGRCLINVDRGWVCWEPVFKAVLRHNMADQILFKSPPEEKYLRQMAEQKEPFMYMPVVWYPEEVAMAERYELNMVAVEVIGYREDAPIMESAFLEGLRQKGLVRLISTLTLANPLADVEAEFQKWGNSRMKGAVLDGNILLSGGHDDDTALLRDPDLGWGWLVERGFNALQTDWTLDMNLYLREKGYNP
ncbi:glycerophosphodiester phosphodiesterase family protein [Oscillospiraceae bacterium 38-13]